jgi:hypothetical protein
LLVVQLQDSDPGASLSVLPSLEAQQEDLWAEVRRETGRGKDRFKIRDLFADERHSQAILNFLSTTDVGRLAPSPAEEVGPEVEARLQLVPTTSIFRALRFFNSCMVRADEE